MLKYNFVYKNQINNIQIPLKNDFDFLVTEDFISEEDFVEKNFIDLEINTYNLSSNVSFTFNFFINGLYFNSFLSAGFTQDEVNFLRKNFRYSYVLIQIYDTFDSKNQSLLHTGYIPVYLFPNKKINTDFQIQPNVQNFEFNNIYISNEFNVVNNQLLFAKFSFFNAKTGKLLPFFNQSFPENTEEKLYYKININKFNKTYSFLNSQIICHQFLNEEFINRINERNKTENKSPLFTQGDLFNIDGDYI